MIIHENLHILTNEHYLSIQIGMCIVKGVHASECSRVSMLQDIIQLLTFVEINIRIYIVPRSMIFTEAEWI
jgi:hypothetical protein